ncbi:MAG: aminopeptidase N [Desulfobulbaceae bacterium]|nr:aminopeptidase N [Desulfobulbaceae bacterium]
MSGKQQKTIFLKDYTPPSYLVTTIDLKFELDETATRVHSKIRFYRNSHAGNTAPLELDGEKLKIETVKLDGVVLPEDAYLYDDKILKIAKVPDSFTLEVINTINPKENTELEGLYLSSGNFCTQCEAEGFRRITCFPDRPDVMAEFRTIIVADRGKYPVLLANGNLVQKGELPDNRHFAVWHDPFKKSCYLFALVAGNLVKIADTYRTGSGREVGLHIYVEPRNREKCGHAMESLKKAMQWDEDRFGLEYDLDVYMIVAVDDFNMGAMENKGLNVFNSKFVLARPETATDADYEGIEGVIAHEYFHNWTGNRVTCRDWFQLSLKEGLTVFRDQEFSADLSSRAVKRIQDVQIIRNYQFREDAGPMAHPVRPDSYKEINNFYTLTVYDKGAEVIRMLHTLLGRDGFRKGIDLYFKRHDGRAATCDDFVAAMLDANDADLDSFKLWYSQAGTPVLKASGGYDPQAQEYRLQLSQYCPPTPGQENKMPMLMPVAVGLLDSRGNDLPLVLKNSQEAAAATLVLRFRNEQETFIFQDIPEQPVLSLLRNYSAPVKVVLERTDEELAFLMAHDSDSFNRWDAGQQLSLKFILEQVDNVHRDAALTVPDVFVSSFRQLLLDRKADPAFVALAISLPMENWIGQQMEVIDPDAIFTVLQFFRRELSRQLHPEFLEVYRENRPTGPYRYVAGDAARRSLKNTCLAYLLSPDASGCAGPDILDLAISQYQGVDNMTDKAAALKAVVNCDREKGDELLADFYELWKDDPLVVDKWLTMQAVCPLPGTLARVKALTEHPAFVLKNPNKVRALIGAFAQANQVRFHDVSGAGYSFLADFIIRLNSMNPQIAARMLTPLTTWKRYDSTRQALMRGELERITAIPDLSGDVAEVAEKSLQ